MISVAFTIEIDRPPAEVFAYLTDPAKLPEWMAIKRSATPDPPGPLRTGSRIAEVNAGPFGREMTSTIAVERLEPDHAFDLRPLDGPIRVAARHRLAPTPAGGTRIDYVAEGAVHGPLRLAEPILRRVLGRSFRRDYAELKRRLEAAPTSTPAR